MKKLLVLALVLALGSMASATLTLNPGGGGTYDIGVGETLTLDVSDDSGIQAGTLMYIIVEEGGDGALSNAIDLPEAGNLAAANPYSEAGWGVGYELASGSTMSDLVAGVQFNVDYVGLVLGDSAVISLWDGYGSFAAPEDSITVNVVPEPMTIALLGLGGLFLRRRK